MTAESPFRHECKPPKATRTGRPVPTLATWRCRDCGYRWKQTEEGWVRKK